MLKFSQAGREILRLFYFFLILSSSSFAQEKSNIEIFNLLIDSSLNEAAKKISAEKVIVEIESATYQPAFNDQIVSSLIKKNFQPVLNSESNGKAFAAVLSLKIIRAEVNYSNMEKESFLGDYSVKRKVKLAGEYLIYNPHKDPELYQFNLSNVDSVRVNSQKNIETDKFNFTKGEMPAEPFFSSALEPIIAITAAAAAVILFFVLRSQ